MTYKKSKYAHVLPGKNTDEVVFFNSRTLDLLAGDLDDLILFEGFKTGRPLIENETVNILAQKGFLVPAVEMEIDNLRKEQRLNAVRNQQSSGNTIGYMRISLTEKCNLKCRYCFVDKIFPEKNDLNQDLFVQIMEWFIKNCKTKNPLVQYFGGEPLLRMDLVKIGHQMLADSQKTGQLMDFQEEIVTNGTLMDREKAEYFIENEIEICFSIDGNKEINDKNRIFANGDGTFERVLEAIDIFKELNGKWGILVTPTVDNLPHFKNMIRYMVEDLGANDISINTPQPYEQGWEIDGHDLAVAIQEVWEYCDEKKVTFKAPGSNIVYLINNRLPQVYSCLNLTYQKNTNTWGIFVSSTGKVSNCVVQCDPRCTCNFEDFKLDEKFIQWHFMDTTGDGCDNCIAGNICGGPCSIEYILSGEKLNKEKCKFYNTLVRWVLRR